MYRQIKGKIDISEPIEKLCSEIDENEENFEVWVETPLGSFQIFFDAKIHHKGNKCFLSLDNIRIYNIKGSLFSENEEKDIIFKDEFEIVVQEENYS